MDCNIFGSCIHSIEKNGDKSDKCKIDQCLLQCDKRKHVVVEENKKKYELSNDDDLIALFQVDDGMITSKDTIKCDNLFVDLTSRFAVLVELKGTDLRHAFEQINSTYMRVGTALKSYRLYARIVTSSRTNVPNLKTSPQYIDLQKKMKSHGGNIQTKANSMCDYVKQM